MELCAKFAETFEVDAPAGRVREAFASLDNIADCYGSVEKVEKVDARTLHITLRPERAFGKAFQGSHRCRFDDAGEMLVWRSLDGFGNMHADGRASFDALGPDRTRVTFQETVTFDMPVSGLLAKAIAPFVDRGVRSAIKGYLVKMRSRI